ncbi:MAG: beta-ketoacyl synthase N-terminal-like domain-containing protein [Planctomycetota bacterium]
MVGVDDIVITGIGCVTSIGIGREAFTQGLRDGKSAVRAVNETGEDRRTIYAAPVTDFDGKQYVKPRKALKVMSPEVQMAYSAAQLAWQDAGLEETQLESDRLGVIYGSELIPGNLDDLVGGVKACVEDGELDLSRWGQVFEKQVYPLWMLRNLPNMPACHVGIAIDARGPNNTIAQEEVSSLLALQEAALMIERDRADLFVVGGMGNRCAPSRITHCWQDNCDRHPYDSSSHDSPRCRPFAEDSQGIVPGAGAGAIVLERRSHAVRRGTQVLARYHGGANRCAAPKTKYGGSRVSSQLAIEAALADAHVEASDLDHINAQGYAYRGLDLEEAIAIEASVGSTPVTAFSPRIGIAGAGCGMLELLGSLVGMQDKRRFGMLGHPGASVDCELELCLEDCKTNSPFFLRHSFTPLGHAAAVVIESEL